MIQELEEAAAKFYKEYPTNPLDKPEWHYNRDVDCFKKRKAFINGAKWQQEQDNKELVMWKLAVEKQEDRCTALRGVISDLQDKNKYSEEEVYNLLCSMPNFFNMTIPQQIKARDEWFEQFKKK
jgi:hypothetical protein